MFRRLGAITPALKQIFLQAYLSITPLTRSNHPESVNRLPDDPFFKLCILSQEMPVGRHFLTLYEFATLSCPAEVILHLCFIDRLIFALMTDYREVFIQDVLAVKSSNTPLIFQRSAAAWSTHPKNYYQAEQMVTLAGELLLGKSLDYAWCHLAIQAGQLKRILQAVQSQDMSMMAEMVLLCHEQVTALEVDWLAWEDPFILGCDPATLKNEREQSGQETLKRFSYTLPMLQRIVEYKSKSLEN